MVLDDVLEDDETRADIDYKALDLYNVNTQEELKTVFWAEGEYQQEGLDQLNRFMRDWRQNEVQQIDPELYTLMHELHDNVDAEQTPIHLLSGLRSKKTNDALRAQGIKTAKKSQHVLGRAADVTIPGVPVSELKEEALDLESGGVGYYPKNKFVHVDTGPKRQW